MVETLDATAIVDRDEPVPIVREAADPAPLQRRQRHHPVGFDAVAVRKHECSRFHPDRERIPSQFDAVTRKEAFYRRGRNGSEQLERLVLGRDQRYPRIEHPLSAQLCGGHQRDLVQRDGPDLLRRQDERDRFRAADRAIVDHTADIGDIPAAAEYVGAAERCAHQRPRCDDERVIAQSLTGAGQERMLLRKHRVERIPDAAQAGGVGHEPRDVVASCLPATERFRDRHRPVQELALGRQQRDLRHMTGEGVQREQRLEPRDAAAGDHDVGTLMANESGSHPPSIVFTVPAEGIGPYPLGRCGFPAAPGNTPSRGPVDAGSPEDNAWFIRIRSRAHTPRFRIMASPTIVVGYDGSEASRAALLFAARQAGLGGRVIIVHSYRLPRRGRRWREYAKALGAEHGAGAELLSDLPLGDPALAGPTYETELMGGSVARALEAVARSRDADEIVVGARQNGEGAEHGSVSRELLGIADRPVVVIPAAAAELEHDDAGVR